VYRIIADNKAIAAPPLQRHSLDRVPSQIDSDHGIWYFGSHVRLWEIAEEMPDHRFPQKYRKILLFMEIIAPLLGFPASIPEG
jgi:hypothetical protein